MTGEYDDIIRMPHYTSAKRPRMSLADRAAQFSPFAALTGFDAAIAETGRLTEQRLALEEFPKNMLDQKQQYLAELLPLQPEITVTYFLPDDRKSGGSYNQAVGHLKKIDPYQRILIMTDGRCIPLDDITDIDSDVFPEL